MKYDIIDYGTVEAEPITLAEAKAFMQIDADYASDDNQINIAISAARERLEQYLNIGLANRDVTIEWNGFELELPLTPNFAIVSLSDKDGVLATDKYTVSEGRNKWVRVNSVSRSGTNYFYNTTFEIVEISFPNGATSETVYTLVYNTGYEENLPTGLKQSLLAEVDYLYKLRGAPVTDFISPNAAMLSSGYSKNLIL